MLPLVFDSDYQKKLLTVSFSEATHLRNTAQMEEWKTRWCDALKTWHSPYKALIDLSQVSWETSERDALYLKLATMLRFLGGFYLRKAAACGSSDAQLPLASFATREEAYTYLNIRLAQGRGSGAENFRSKILVDNHFNQKLVEIAFEGAVHLDDPQQISVIRSKLTNNLMHWHSPWYLLWDFTAVESLSADLSGELKSMLRFLASFFMQQALTYGNTHIADLACFGLISCRTRHKALTKISQHQHNQGDAGVEADGESCPSRG